MTETDTNILRERLRQLDSAIANYEELDSDLEAPEYVARGNGFCDSKYSEDFIEGQLAQLRNERATVSAQLERLTATQA